MGSDYIEYMVKTDKREFIVEAKDGVHAKERADRIAENNNENIKSIYRHNEET
jgi:hypothetical protein